MQSVVITSPLTPDAVATILVAAVLEQVVVVVGLAGGGVLVSANAAPLALTLPLDEVVHGVVLASRLRSFTVVAVRRHRAPCLSLTERVLV